MPSVDIEKRKLYQREWYSKNIDKCRAYNKKSREKCAARVKEYNRIYREQHPNQMREYYLNNKERINSQNRSYYYNNKERALACNRKRLYNLSQSDYDNLYRSQNGNCAICGKSGENQSEKTFLVVDHDHETGKVRGLLCAHCNSMLGHAYDSKDILAAAIKYLIC